MANINPWFKHYATAHNDLWLRHLVRKEGHVAGWIWWVLLELLHKHGRGNTLIMNISDIAHAAASSNSVVTRVLTQMATEFQGQSKLSWNSVGTQLELEIKNFREKQHNLKVKTGPKAFQNGSKISKEVDVEEEVETYSPFYQFWNSYPRKTAKSVALKAWLKLNPGEDLIITLMAALEVHKKNPDWEKEDGKFIPHPATWLNQKRWEDEIKPSQEVAANDPRYC